MQWIDVMGPPGVGKSTLLDAIWPPRAIKGDGAAPLPEWAPFMNCAWTLYALVRNHPSARACQSMMNRSFAKMATVARRDDPRTYMQTGFAQRGLGLGWRLADPERVAEYYRLMPVSLGVVILTAPVDLVQQRNVERGKDRSHMVPLMVRPLEIAREVLAARGVPVLTLSTAASVRQCRLALEVFADRLGAVLPEGPEAAEGPPRAGLQAAGG